MSIDCKSRYEAERQRRREVEILREALDELRWRDSHRDPGEVEVIARWALEKVGLQDV